MGQVRVNGQKLNVDIRDELEQYDWSRPKWSDAKLIAASPFRYETHPSFFVSLEHGGWADSGADDVEWESGNFPKLLSFLRRETYEETCDYLIELYGVHKMVENAEVKIPAISLHRDYTKVTISNKVKIKQQKSTYLSNRGISEKVQRFMGVGEENGSIALPWRHIDGSLGNMKYRSTSSKIFWYVSGGASIGSMVYGIDKVYKHGLKEVVICDAEIDALSWMTAGRAAIALGNSALTDDRIELIRKSPIETAIVSTDNDGPGRKLRGALASSLAGYMRVKGVEIPGQYKDANEVLVAGVSLMSLQIGELEYLFD